MPKISRAIAIRNFLDRLQFPSPKSGQNVMQVICTSFDLSTDSSAALLLVHSQVENFDRLFFEIQNSSIGDEAKGIYRGHIKKLSGLVRYPALYGNAENAKNEIIKPHYHTLTLVGDALGINSEFDESTRGEIDSALEKLEDLYQQIADSEMESRLKSAVLPQLSNLIFLLKNIDALGFDRAWEAASAAMVSIYKQSQTAATEKEKGILQRLALSTTLVVGILAGVDTGIKHASSIASQAKGLYEFLLESEKRHIPQIEDKRESNSITEQA